MKLGKNFEGTSQELEDLCENYNFDPSQFFNENSGHKIHWGWIVLIVLIFIGTSAILWTIPLDEILRKILIIVNFLLVLSITVCFQLKFKNWGISGLIFISLLTVLALSLDYLTPQEAIDEYRENKFMNNN